MSLVVRGIGWALSAVVSGCGFQLTPNGAVGDDAAVDAAPDGSTIEPDVLPIDAMPIAHKLYGASDTQLYAIDVDAQMATLVGTFSMGATVFDVGGLAFDGANLIGLSDNGSELLVIDPNTAAVTARRVISPAGTYYGLTVAPAGEAEPSAVVFAGATGSKLVKVDVATGNATTIGSYGGGMSFYTDLAWVSGVGLFVTLQSGACDPRCVARLDPTTGVATTIRTNLALDVFGLSGYRGMLWALDHDGPVRLMSQTDGITTMVFDPDIAWTEAAQ